jgi:surfactin synthase thioesterase subunit
MTMSKTPKKTQQQIALVYEKCWNEVVSQMAPWRRKVITENFEVIDGHHVYPNRKDQEIAAAAAHQASKDADAIIYEMFTGKY